jgi:hypothetical protein
MLYTMAQRDNARAIQDKLIRLADKYGYEDGMRVSTDLPASITLGTLRTFIYPEYLADIARVIHNLESRSR